jgi:hypothetical protein
LIPEDQRGRGHDVAPDSAHEAYWRTLARPTTVSLLDGKPAPSGFEGGVQDVEIPHGSHLDVPSWMGMSV